MKVNISQVENGYIVTYDRNLFADVTYCFNTFAEMMDFLFKHFGEEVKKE